jgi:hypothetical protein
VLVVRRDEHREWHLFHAYHIDDLEASEPRHLDVEEHEVG